MSIRGLDGLAMAGLWPNDRRSPRSFFRRVVTCVASESSLTPKGKTMTKRSLLLLGVLAMSILSIASAKSYTVSFTSRVTVGTAQLPAGEYSLKVNGSNAVFTNVDSNKSVTTPVKIENVDKKYGTTTVETTQQGNATRIEDIQLGGSTTKLEFN